MRTFFACLMGMLLVGLAGCGAGAGSASNPAATVNGHAIAVADYRQAFSVERRQQTVQLGFDACTTKGMNFLCSQWKHSALKTLIENEIIAEYARQHHIVLTQAQKLANWKAIDKTRFATPAVLQAFLKVNHESYSFLRASIDADLLRTKVLFPITKNMKPYAPAVALGVVSLHTKKSFQLAEKLVRQGLPFPALIGDMLGQQGACLPNGCTELGWVPYPFLEPGLDAVKTARIGSVVGPIVHQQDWELYKVWNRTQFFHLTTAELYQRRAQLLQAWLDQKIRAATIKRYVAA